MIGKSIDPYKHLLAWTGYFGLIACLLFLLASPSATIIAKLPAFTLGFTASILLSVFSLLPPRNHRNVTEEISIANDHGICHDTFQRLPDLIWSIDYASRNVTSLTHVYRDTHPQAKEKNARLATLLPARIARLYLENLIELQNKQETIRFEYQLGETNGASHTFEARLIAGKCECIAIIRDISHVKATEEALINQQIFLQKIVDNSPDLIFVRDRHGRFLLVNRATQATLGHDLLTQSHTGLTEDQIPFLTGDQEVLQTGETAEVIEKITLPNGQTRWYSVIKLPLVRNGDTYLLAIAVDITQHHAIEAAQSGADAFARSVIDVLPIPFVLLENDSIVYTNRAASQLLQTAVEDLFHANFIQLCEQHHLNTTSTQAIDCAGIALQLVVLEKASSAA